MWRPWRVAGALPDPAPLPEDARLESAERGQPREAEQIVAMCQVAVAAGADQPAMLRPAQAAMEGVVELGAGDGPVGRSRDTGRDRARPPSPG